MGGFGFAKLGEKLLLFNFEGSNLLEIVIDKSVQFRQFEVKILEGESIFVPSIFSFTMFIFETIFFSKSVGKSSLTVVEILLLNAICYRIDNELFGKLNKICFELGKLFPKTEALCFTFANSICSFDQLVVYIFGFLANFEQLIFL